MDATPVAGAAGGWILVTYSAPTEPSTARVAVWRGLKRLGALYLAASVCVLPAGARREALLEKIGGSLRSGGGTFEVHRIAAFAGSEEADLITRFNAARNAEYDEIVESAERTLAELRRESDAGKLSFAEVEENEADTTRLRKWLRRVMDRDVFGAPRRVAAASAVNEAEDMLSDFTSQVLAIDDN